MSDQEPNIDPMYKLRFLCTIVEDKSNFYICCKILCSFWSNVTIIVIAIPIAIVESISAQQASANHYNSLKRSRVSQLSLIYC